VPVPVPVLVASHFFIGRCRRPINFGISAHLPMPYMYFNSFANYFGINGLQTGTKCMLVCAGLIARPTASHFLFLPVYQHHKCILIVLPIISA